MEVETTESLAAKIQVQQTLLSDLRKKLEELSNTEDTLKNIKLFFLKNDDSKNVNNIKLPPEQGLLFNTSVEFLVSSAGLNTFYESVANYDVELKHIINHYIYGYKARLELRDYLAQQVKNTFKSDERKLKQDIYLFEIQVYPTLDKTTSFSIDQFPRDFPSEIKVGDKVYRENFTLLSHNPNTVLNSAVSGDYSTNVLIVHKLTSDIKAISVSHICSSYESHGVIVLEDGIIMTVKKVDEVVEIPVLLVRENQSILRKVKVIYTELTKR
jgi:hypothetical protein